MVLLLLFCVAVDWTYTIESAEYTVSDGKSVTLITEDCSIISPRVLLTYANRTVYETHLSILSNIESAMLLSVSTSGTWWW